MSDNVKGFKAIYVNNGVFLASNKLHDSTIKTLLVNGKKGRDTHLSKWSFFLGVTRITQVEKKITGKNVPQCWVLSDESLFNEGKIPMQLPLDDLYSDYEDGFSGKMASLGSLYEVKYEREPDKLENMEFTILEELRYDVDEHNPPIDFKTLKIGVSTYDRSMDRKCQAPKTSTMDQLLFPGVIQQHRPCFFSSEETYNIIRWYIRQNIDLEQAKFHIDANNFLKVMKKVKKEPIYWKTEIKRVNGRSYARPRFTNHTSSHDLVEVFEMTHAARPYDGYTTIKGFSGDNQEDLKAKIDAYLEELMLVINTPAKRCESCAGVGNTFDTLDNINRRE